MSRRLAAQSAEPAPATLADWERVFAAELDYIRWTLRNLGAPATDVEDVAQEVCLAMWRRRSSYDPARPLRPWIAGIAFRSLHEHRRRGRREVAGGLLDRPDEAGSQEDLVASAQARRLVLAALAALPPKQRAVLVMHELDGLAMREIAHALEEPLFTLYSRLQRGRRAFAKQLRRLEAGNTLREGPAALLATQRTPGPTSASARRRSLERVRALIAGGLSEPATPPARSWRLRLPLVAAAALMLLVTGFLALRRHPDARGVALAPAADPLAAGLVGYWRFDEGRGLIAADRSGTGNDCRLEHVAPAAAWTDGALGGGIAFTGGSWLTCPGGGALGAIDDELTIAAWVTDGQVVAYYHALVARQMSDGRQDDFMFGFANGQLLFTSHAWRGRIMHALPPARAPWFHVAVTRRADGTAILYADGVELVRGRTARTKLPHDGHPLILGAALNGPDPAHTQARFDGRLDELLIYRRALAPDEIAALAARRQPVVQLQAKRTQ